MRSRLALAIAALCVASAAQADWKKDYDRGVKAAESGNWAEAESAMRAALAEDAKPDARKRFQGVVYKVYVPHHYAGLAAYRQGDCQGAADFWNNAANKAVVSGIAALDAVEDKGIADCNAKLAAATKPAPPVAVATPPPVPGPTTTPAPTPSKPAPQVATATPAKPPVATPAKPPEPVAAKPVPVAPAAVPAPAALVQNVQDFLDGRYAAVSQSDPNALGDARAKAQGFLLRAASRHTLGELGDARQLELARADVRAARGANPALAPDETLFSPRFRAFWSATR
jgi:hypothetical protein